MDHDLCTGHLDIMSAVYDDATTFSQYKELISLDHRKSLHKSGNLIQIPHRMFMTYCAGSAPEKKKDVGFGGTTTEVAFFFFFLVSKNSAP